MSSFDAAARRLHPDAYEAPDEDEALPNVGDVIAAAGLRKGSSAEASGRVVAIKRAKDKGEKRKRDRGDKIVHVELEDGGGLRKTRLLHLPWRVVRAAAPTPAAAPPRDAAAFLKTMRSGARVVAPMVGGSELAFRLLCRRHGATVAYTPMLEASKFVEDAEFRASFFQTHADDHPLVAHFCGDDPSTVGRACRMAADLGADAVDLNLGCPQRVAFAGHYGSRAPARVCLRDARPCAERLNQPLRFVGSRGDAAAASWIVRGPAESRFGAVAATPRPRAGSFEGAERSSAQATSSATTTGRRSWPS